MTRDIERGVRGIESLVSFALFNIGWPRWSRCCWCCTVLGSTLRRLGFAVITLTALVLLHRVHRGW
jgi:ABC-type transport system involved in Fe-S cluster assembly fused permease/ATPase subunit